MKKLLKSVPMVLVLLCSSYSQSGGVLLDSSSLEYLGAFNVPDVSGSENSFAWVGTGIAHNPANNSLFIVGHDHYQRVGEISIPEPGKTDDCVSLPTASVIQGATDITEGHLTEIGVNGAALDNSNRNIKIGGLLVNNDKLYGTSYAYYENAYDVERSHFSSGLKLSDQGDYDGMYTVGSDDPGRIGGYMANVPKEWQDSLGATALSGNACIPIIARSSLGPCISTFNPDKMGESDPNDSKSLVYYTNEHPTLGTFPNEDSANPVYCMSTKVRGVVFPERSKSIIFFGRTGLGIPEYGAGTADISLDGQKVDGYDEYYVYDPASPQTKGPHAWPYRCYAWAYDVQDFTAVLRGEKEPWEVVPYSHWIIELPFTADTSAFLLGGAAYDPSTDRIFIYQKKVNNAKPLIHVFKVNYTTGISSSINTSNINGRVKNVNLFGNSCSFKTGNIEMGEYSIYLTSPNGRKVLLNKLGLLSNKSYVVKSEKLSKNMASSGVYFIEIRNKKSGWIYRGKSIRL